MCFDVSLPLQDNQFLSLSQSLLWSLLYLGLVSQKAPDVPRPRLHEATLTAVLVLALVSMALFFAKKLVYLSRQAMRSAQQRQQQAEVTWSKVSGESSSDSSSWRVDNLDLAASTSSATAIASLSS